MKAAMMLEDGYDPMFKLSLAAKDARLAAGAADELDLDLPMLEAIAERLTAAAEDHGDKDMAATYLVSAPTRRAAAR
jgi:3-hydroxyisobutyrate dehydrogenase-like beta-hydroxyacid dehydrogenase